MKHITREKLALLSYLDSPDLPKAIVMLKPRRMEYVGIGWIDCGEPQGDEVIVDDHPPPYGLTDEQYEALRTYAREHGRTWKSQLNHAWTTCHYDGTADHSELQRIRNQFGPSWLVRFRFPKGVR